MVTFVAVKKFCGEVLSDFVGYTGIPPKLQCGESGEKNDDWPVDSEKPKCAMLVDWD